MQDWFIPDGIDVHDVLEPPELQDTLTHRAPRADGIVRIAAILRRHRELYLAERPVASIIETLDRLAMMWVDPDLPERRAAVGAIAQRTGISREMVGHAIDLEMRSSRGPDLWAALERELGDPRALDGFVPVAALKGRAFAVGPGLVGGIFSSNIPALPHLTIMRALLVKAACLGRTSSDEPIFLPLYLRTMEQIDPNLAACVAVVRWDRGDRAIEARFLRSIDHLVAYGGDAALEAIRDRCPPGLTASWHGHRTGLAIVLRESLTRAALPTLADALAYDFSLFDQHACLSPQALYVERGGEVTPEMLAAALNGAMTRWLERLPPRALPPEQLGARRGILAQLEMREAMGEPVSLASGARRLQGVVTIEPPAPLQPSALDRFVRVFPVPSWEDVMSLIQPARGRLQNVAVAGEGERAERLKRVLARLGCSRICPPGRMGTPSMMWQHDGLPRLGELVRWCDEEEGGHDAAGG